MELPTPHEAVLTHSEKVERGLLVSLARFEYVVRRHYAVPVCVTPAVWQIVEEGAAGNEEGLSEADVVHDILWMSYSYVVARPDAQTTAFRVIVMGGADPDFQKDHRPVYHLVLHLHGDEHMRPVATIMREREWRGPPARRCSS